jgi:hypothetical protein
MYCFTISNMATKCIIQLFGGAGDKISTWHQNVSAIVKYIHDNTSGPKDRFLKELQWPDSFTAQSLFTSLDGRHFSEIMLVGILKKLVFRVSVLGFG